MRHLNASNVAVLSTLLVHDGHRFSTFQNSRLVGIVRSEPHRILKSAKPFMPCHQSGRDWLTGLRNAWTVSALKQRAGLFHNCCLGMGVMAWSKFAVP